MIKLNLKAIKIIASLMLVLTTSISCKNSEKVDSTKSTQETSEVVKLNWWTSVYSLGYKSDNSLKLGDINNLDKIYGFRLAKFNMDISSYKITGKNYTYLNDETESPISEKLEQENYNWLDINMGSPISDQLNKGVISSARLTFLQRKLKMIELQYIEGLYNNGVEVMNLNKNQNEPADYSEITLFDFYRKVLGEPTQIYVAHKNFGKYELIEDKNMYEVLKTLDRVKEMDVKFIWETDKVYFEIFFDSSFDDDLTGTNKEVKENYKQFKLFIKTYIKEDKINEKLKDGMKNFLKFKNEKRQNIMKEEDDEKLNTL